MDHELLDQLDYWHSEDEYEEIINKIMGISEAEWDYDLICHLGRALNNQDNYNEAIKYFLSVQEQGEHDPLWHFRIGYAYYYLNQYKEAIVAFEQSLALDPEDSHARMFLEMSLNRAGIMNVEQDEDLLEVEEKINPFKLVAHNNGSISLILNVGKYKHEIFQTRAEEGFEGNGYDWESLAAVFLEEKMPHLVDILKFDPEAGMFAAYTDNKEAILGFAIAFKEACDDDLLIQDLFSRAKLDVLKEHFVKKSSSDIEYLKDMYADGYFPDFLVDKVKAELVKVVEFLEQGHQDIEEIQSKLDFAIHAINDLAEEFDENDSEIETVGRESIGQTVKDILDFFGIKIHIEEAIRERDW